MRELRFGRKYRERCQRQEGMRELRKETDRKNWQENLQTRVKEEVWKVLKN